MNVARRFGVITNVAIKQLIHAIRDSVFEFRSIMLNNVPYEFVESNMINEFVSILNKWVDAFAQVMKSLDMELSFEERNRLKALVHSVASISWGEVAWRLLYNYDEDDPRDVILDLFDFIDSRVYNILQDGFYRTIRSVVYAKLEAKNKEMNVKWYSMNNQFKHQICLQREQIGAVKLREVPDVFHNLHEDGYNFLHPHFLCDGIFLPVSQNGGTDYGVEE